MAYVSQDLKAKLAPTIKATCKKYGIKASIAVRNHMTLCLNIKSGEIDTDARSSASNRIFGVEVYDNRIVLTSTGFDRTVTIDVEIHIVDINDAVARIDVLLVNNQGG